MPAGDTKLNGKNLQLVAAKIDLANGTMQITGVAPPTSKRAIRPAQKSYEVIVGPLPNVGFSKRQLMNVHCDPPFALGSFSGSIEPPILHGTFVCKIGLILGPDGRCCIDTEPANLDVEKFVAAGGAGREFIQDTDFAPRKTAADVLLTAMLPRLPADKSAMPLRLRVGNLTKQILAVGGAADRSGADP